ncbi:unnamed protein product [Didymodactylos carnosus]|uniref:Uncharacterized protein n=1 Tax=Didymodactylos carnosus TaxID=1234261 RepID=A0A813QSG9_9BILA|nr:unnamed protein product [Didymodactylos carnosus]CAF3552672.1 unnamed protein product [Didymodactylos carnosus]
MGRIYTGLRTIIQLKKNWIPIINQMIYAYATTKNSSGWKEIAAHHPKIELFSRQKKSNMIPWGQLRYMPKSWYETSNYSRNTIDLQSGLWCFQCSLQNNHQTIELFFKFVLPVISKDILYLELLEEKSLHSELYKMKNGKIVQTQIGTYLYDPEYHDEYQ